MDESTLVTRVALRNYKSIAACDVRLGPLTFLVGANGSGKSNFIDALRFVSDAVRGSLESALRTRGGVEEVRRRGSRGVRSFRIVIDVQAAPNVSAEYVLEVATEKATGFRILQERCSVVDVQSGEILDEFLVRNGMVTKLKLRALVDGAERHFLMDPAQVARAALFLPAVSAISDTIRQISTSLSAMAFYNINPHSIQLPNRALPTDQLFPDGGNLSSVFRKLQTTDLTVVQSILDYLRLILPNIVDVDVASVGGLEVLEFKQKFNDHRTERFYAESVSDGTLRALAILVALFQTSAVPWMNPQLVTIEEPELALHPAAAGILLDALRIASLEKQVIVTSHSADLLDDREIDDDSILAVGLDDSVTQIGPIDAVGRGILRDRLFTPGELLRRGYLTPDAGLLVVDPSPTLSAVG